MNLSGCVCETNLTFSEKDEHHNITDLNIMPITGRWSAIAYIPFKPYIYT